MEPTALDDFRRRLESWGMCWAPDRDAPRFTELATESEWPWPGVGGVTRGFRLAEFILDAIDASALGTEAGWYALPASGVWLKGDDRDFYRIRDALVAALGVPIGFEGAAYFSHSERDQLAALVYARSFMIDVDYVGDATDDTWIYPSHGRLCLHFWHEDRTYATAHGPEALRQFDGELEKIGWGWLRDPEKNP